MSADVPGFALQCLALSVASAFRLSVSPSRLPAVMPAPLIDSQSQALAPLQCDRDVLQ